MSNTNTKIKLEFHLEYPNGKTSNSIEDEADIILVLSGKKNSFGTTFSAFSLDAENEATLSDSDLFSFWVMLTDLLANRLIEDSPAHGIVQAVLNAIDRVTDGNATVFTGTTQYGGEKEVN